MPQFQIESTPIYRNVCKIFSIDRLERKKERDQAANDSKVLGFIMVKIFECIRYFLCIIIFGVKETKQ